MAGRQAWEGPGVEGELTRGLLISVLICFIDFTSFSSLGAPRSAGLRVPMQAVDIVHPWALDPKPPPPPPLEPSPLQSADRAPLDPGP